MNSSNATTYFGSDLIHHIKGCVLGLAIAMAGVSSAYAIDGGDEAESADSTQAEVSSDIELDIDAAVDSSERIADLSVDPTGDLVYPDDRPAWLDQAPTLDDKPAVWPVKSLLCESPEKARESLEIQVQGAMAAYAELALRELVGDDEVNAGAADRLIGSKLLAVDLDSNSLEHYAGTVEDGGATRYEEAVKLTFDQKFDRRLVRAWKEHEVEGRLTTLGFAGGAGLCLLMAGTGVVRRISRRTQAT